MWHRPNTCSTCCMGTPHSPVGADAEAQEVGLPHLRALHTPETTFIFTTCLLAVDVVSAEPSNLLLWHAYNTPACLAAQPWTSTQGPGHDQWLVMERCEEVVKCFMHNKELRSWSGVDCIQLLNLHCTSTGRYAPLFQHLPSPGVPAVFPLT